MRFHRLLALFFTLAVPVFAVPSKLYLTDQFGGISNNIVGGSSGMPIVPGSSNIVSFAGATAPVNGTTGDNFAAKGSLYFAIDTGIAYRNTGTITAPVWAAIPSGGAVTVLTTPITGFVSGAGTLSASDTILSAFNKLSGNTQNLPVISNVLTGFVSGAGTVAASDTILQGFNKLVGNTQNLAVINNVLTGYVSGAGTISASDSVLSAIQKLNGNVGVYSESSPSLTFDHSVGAKTAKVKQVGNLVSVTVPAGAISDGAGTVCASTALAAGYRPAYAVTFSILVIDNGTTRKAGQVVIGTDGVLTLSVLGTGFTNAAAAGWDAFAISYAL